MVKTTKTSKRATGYILGRHSFAKISAVEGIRASSQMAKDFGDFDRKALSPKERREALAGKYGVKR